MRAAIPTTHDQLAMPSPSPSVQQSISLSSIAADGVLSARLLGSSEPHVIEAILTIRTATQRLQNLCSLCGQPGEDFDAIRTAAKLIPTLLDEFAKLAPKLSTPFYTGRIERSAAVILAELSKMNPSQQ